MEKYIAFHYKNYTFIFPSKVGEPGSCSRYVSYEINNEEKMIHIELTKEKIKKLIKCFKRLESI